MGAGDNPHAAQDWFYGQRARPYPAIPAMAWTGALRRSSLPSVMPYRAGLRALAATSWTAIGPAPTGATPNTDVFGSNSGRVTALAFDASNNILYAGAAEGGLWKTADGGSTWAPLTDNQPSLAVGAIAIDPTRPQTLYVGTGEPNNNGDGYYGAGILKTTDGGVSWTLLGADAATFGGGRYATHYGTTISRIALDPNNAQHILVGASNGFWFSPDGGATWARTGLNVLGSRQVSNVVVDSSTSPSTVLVAYGDSFGATGNGLYRSTDGGLTFGGARYGAGGLPTGANVGRISLAQAPSRAQRLYFVAADPLSSASLGLWQSDDHGATWQRKTLAAAGGADLFGADSAPDNQQGFYDQVIEVDPTNPDTVYVGGINVWKSTDGGASFPDLTNVYTTNTFTPHPDQHAILFHGGALYLGNDGGVYSSTDGEASWHDDNGNLAITQFCGGSTSANFTTNPVVWGGTQDNGMQKYTSSMIWTKPFGGDGGFTANDPANPAVAYEEYVYLNINKTTDGGATWNPASAGLNPNNSDNVLFIAPFVMDPSNANRLLAGTNYIYETTNGAATWTRISPSLPADSTSYFGAVSAIAVAPSAPQTVYAGTGDGQIRVTTDDGGAAHDHWQALTSTSADQRHGSLCHVLWDQPG